ncbi:acylneuraminate cytidylyltransferase family protein [Candidatus Dependentiae bacterium]|nr:acylneuraminate cytidylyltransferase family protein [Candidatus Dependentiae bacterium]
MYKEKKILALIPARGGSKGLPGKNLKKLCGIHLIGWTINHAKSSVLIDKIIVSTDSQEISEISKQYGAEVPFLRPDYLASDSSKVIDTIFHCLDYYGKSGEKFDYVLLLEPTSPLRKKNDIDNALKLIIDNENRADSCISVGEIALEHPVYSKKIDSEGFVKPYIENDKTSQMRQFLSKAYFPYGVVYISKVDSMKKYNEVYSGNIIPYIIERWQNYEINDIYDFLCVETIMKHRENEL